MDAAIVFNKSANAIHLGTALPIIDFVNKLLDNFNPLIKIYREYRFC